eukprot:CAMPEP_0114601578 /NCGR_PEP_ID=MMETSP0125-20121206/24210_1 /TAXON_ID=485358 ORGANISM="Aristerostoma sp., Strain ATCC 50986" /NCGR_SAMPLE_ID=MMETSP0125 /ASSEMBLY_ACC=CAM_ASM_000245 /LENGTH=42 /DNA_ID= /DNA_START= /DNA_END= /DNA_ORIENTATION=
MSSSNPSDRLKEFEGFIKRASKKKWVEVDEGQINMHWKPEYD